MKSPDHDEQLVATLHAPFDTRVLLQILQCLNYTPFEPPGAIHVAQSSDGQTELRVYRLVPKPNQPPNLNGHPSFPYVAPPMYPTAVPYNEGGAAIGRDRVPVPPDYGGAQY